MDVQQLLRKYALDGDATALVTDAMQALVDAEMVDTITVLRTRIFGSHKCLELDQQTRCFVWRPFVELALLELRDVADREDWTVTIKQRRALAVLEAAGFHVGAEEVWPA